MPVSRNTVPLHAINTTAGAKRESTLHAPAARTAGAGRSRGSGKAGAHRVDWMRLPPTYMLKLADKLPSADRVQWSRTCKRMQTLLAATISHARVAETSQRDDDTILGALRYEEVRKAVMADYPLLMPDWSLSLPQGFNVGVELSHLCDRLLGGSRPGPCPVPALARLIAAMYKRPEVSPARMRALDALLVKRLAGEPDAIWMACLVSLLPCEKSPSRRHMLDKAMGGRLGSLACNREVERIASRVGTHVDFLLPKAQQFPAWMAMLLSPEWTMAAGSVLDAAMAPERTRSEAARLLIVYCRRPEFRDRHPNRLAQAFGMLDADTATTVLAAILNDANASGRHVFDLACRRAFSVLSAVVPAAERGRMLREALRQPMRNRTESARWRIANRLLSETASTLSYVDRESVLVGLAGAYRLRVGFDAVTMGRAAYEGDVRHGASAAAPDAIRPAGDVVPNLVSDSDLIATFDVLFDAIQLLAPDARAKGYHHLREACVRQTRRAGWVIRLAIIERAIAEGEHERLAHSAGTAVRHFDAVRLAPAEPVQSA